MGLKIAIVAGEASGDLLGAALIRALRQRHPDAKFYGVAGPRMRGEGCEALAQVEELSVMGIAEVLRHLPRLLRLGNALTARFIGDRPDVYIGIDAPDFNLRLERRLKDAGLRTVHVVSPSVWAWRENRVHGIKKAVDLMLCLLPFEPRFYEGHAVPAAYIGHPLAEEIQAVADTAAARRALGLPEKGRVVAMLPGSRAFEVKYLSPAYAAAAALLAKGDPGLRFVVPVARPDLRPVLERAIAAHAPALSWHLVDGQSLAAMRAADAVLVASGTATLECLLAGRPMVIAYRANPFSIWLLRRLAKIDKAGLPNLLTAALRARPGASFAEAVAGEPLVPELLQENATPEKLAAAVDRLLRDPAARASQLEPFAAVHRELQRDAAAQAAVEIGRLLGKAA